MKICIIKLGAKGDVVRALPILIGIKEKYSNSEITWITKLSSKEILETSSYINKILTLPLNTNEINNFFENSNFDILYNFDIEEEATKLAVEIKADKKYGFYSENNYPTCFNLSAEYYLNTLFDDELKKSNKKTYQQMIFEIAELPYKKQHHPIYLNEEDKKYAEDFIKRNNINKEKLIGIHIGSSPRWPSKKWHLDNIKDFIIKAKNKGYEILLFSGQDEKNYFQPLIQNLESQEIKIYLNNQDNTDKEFFALVNICSKIISGDSFALHVALTLEKPTIGLFFCTSPNEIEDYGLLTKLIAPKLYDFFPEKMDVYNEELTKSISVDEVLESIKLNNLR